MKEDKCLERESMMSLFLDREALEIENAKVEIVRTRRPIYRQRG